MCSKGCTAVLELLATPARAIIIAADPGRRARSRGLPGGAAQEKIDVREIFGLVRFYTDDYLPVVSFTKRDNLHGCGLTARALHAHGRVPQLHRTTRPRQVGPSSSRELLVDVAARTRALPAPGHPPALDRKDQPRLAHHRQAADGHDTLARRRLEERLLHLPPVEPQDLCQNLRALSHPVLRFPVRKPM